MVDYGFPQIKEKQAKMNQSLLLDVGLIMSRLLVGGMLLLAGVLKLKAEPRWLLQQILAYRLVKGKVAWLFARGLPLAEICCGILLIIGFLTPMMIIMTFALLWGFSVALVSTFLRGKPVDCGCFGRSKNTHAQQMRWTVVYRNLGMLFALVIISAADYTPLSLDIVLNKWFHWMNLPVFPASWLMAFWLISLFFIIGFQGITRWQWLSGEKLNRNY